MQPATTDNNNSVSHAGNNEQHPTIKLSSVSLEKVYTLRLLEIQLTDTLLWNQHVLSTSKMINCMLGAIRRVRSVANANKRHRLFQTYVMPRLQYCLPI